MRVVTMLLAALLAITSARFVHTILAPHRAVAAPVEAVNCSATTLRVRPGLHPPVPDFQVRLAGDIPRGRFTVSLPVYPGATPLNPYVASPFESIPSDPYLQTASAEYASTNNSDTVESWFATTLPRCGWHQHGSSYNGGSILTDGLAFISNRNSHLGVDVSFGSAPSGGTYIAYAVEEIILPPRPASSYLRGQFSQVRLALQHRVTRNGEEVAQVVYRTVTSRQAIDRLIGAINAIKDYRTVQPICSSGAYYMLGPAWLSFRRPNGSIVHGWERGPGECGGLTINGVRWLTDPGTVWKQIRSLAGERG